MDIPTFSWANLSPQLLAMIATCLRTRINPAPDDICRFRSVCTSWRSSVPPIRNPLYSHIRQHPPGHGQYNDKNMYRIEPITQSSSSSMKSWLMCVEEVGGGKVHLINPFTGQRMKPLPPTFPKELDLTHFRLTMLQRMYRLESEIKEQTNDSIYMMFQEMLKLDRIVAQKVVILSSSGDLNDNNMICVLQRGGILSFYQCVVANKSSPWFKNLSNECPFEDIARYKGKLCAIDKDGKSIIVDSSLNVTEIARDEYTTATSRHLVESDGDVFLAELQEGFTGYVYDLYAEMYSGNLLPPETDHSFRIWKLNSEEEFRWVEVKSLGDRILFTSNKSVGAYWSFSISASLNSFSLRNCVVFKDPQKCDVFKEEGDEYNLSNMSVFSLESGRLEFVNWNFFRRDAEMFWPPPNWLRINSNLSD